MSNDASIVEKILWTRLALAQSSNCDIMFEADSYIKTISQGTGLWKKFSGSGKTPNHPQTLS